MSNSIRSDKKDRKISTKIVELLKEINKNRVPYLFLMPKLIFFVVFLIIPIAWSVLLSFQKYGVFNSEWVGLKNYIDAFRNQVFRAALWNTLRYTLITVPSFTFIALVIAGLLQPLGKRSQNFFRGVFYLPSVTSMVIIAMVWRWMYNYRFGIFNYILSFFGLAPVDWLGQSATALPALMLMTILIPPGSGIIIYSAAINNINPSLYEAAEIDGANGFQKWLKITIPLLKPTTLYLVVLYTISSFQVFTQIMMMTKGGPGYATETIVYIIYKTAFRDFNFGLASAQAVLLFFIIMIFAVVQFKILKSDNE